MAKCGGKAIDGILYASARKNGATAVVLFADTHAVADPQMDSESAASEALEFGATWLDMIDYREVTYDPETAPTRWMAAAKLVSVYRSAWRSA